MVTGRRSENALEGLIRAHGVSVETIGDATAPRDTFEAVFEGHRAACAIRVPIPDCRACDYRDSSIP